MYIETSSNLHGNTVFVSWERTDNIQISNITFYYNRFLNLTNDSLKEWVGLEFNYYYRKILGVLNIIYVKMIDMVVHQLSGL